MGDARLRRHARNLCFERGRLWLNSAQLCLTRRAVLVDFAARVRLRLAKECLAVCAR